MIKYLELTAPDAEKFRQVKILSVEVDPDDHVIAGDALFTVKKGDEVFDLPATQTGKIIEVIASQNENISLMTPLVLMETIVESGSAPMPTTPYDAPAVTNTTEIDGSQSAVTAASNELNNTSSSKPINTAERLRNDEKRRRTEQQSLDLLGVNMNQPPANEASDDSPEQDSQNHEELLVLTSIVEESSPTATTSNTESIALSVPDIGGDTAQVVEILVKVGDKVAVEDALVTLESDKANMEVPSTHAGIIESIAVQIDQEISEGSVLLILSCPIETSVEEDQPSIQQPSTKPESNKESSATEASATETKTIQPDTPNMQLLEVKIPDIGGDSAKVIEILVSVGQQIELEDALVTLESDKASMEVPSSAAGTIQSIDVELDQDVSEGTVVIRVASTAATQQAQTAPAEQQKTVSNRPDSSKANTETTENTASMAVAPAASEAKIAAPAAAPQAASTSHASPSVRRFARELGAELNSIDGSGRKGRIVKADVAQFVKSAMTGAKTGGTSNAVTQQTGGTGIPPIPAIDFTKFGEIDLQPLNKIKRLTAANLHRSWLNVPHVTHSDESDISDLESFRKQLNTEYVKQKNGIKLSPLAFIVKAVVNALQTFPQFNSSLEPGGENLIYKKYINIGIAVETPNGLVVPVLHNADKMSIADIATAMGELAEKARDKKLTMADMSGASFTISSLGGIGGTHFTPIINAPEVAILGVSRSKMQPVWNGSDFQPGMILPLSLSYDHRVIDGAEAARFTRRIAAVLEDVRRLAI